MRIKLYSIARIIEHPGGGAEAKLYHQFMSTDEELVHLQAEELEKVTGQEHVVVDANSLLEAFEALKKYQDLKSDGSKH